MQRWKSEPDDGTPANVTWLSGGVLAVLPAPGLTPSELSRVSERAQRVFNVRLELLDSTALRLHRETRALVVGDSLHDCWGLLWAAAAALVSFAWQDLIALLDVAQRHGIGTCRPRHIKRREGERERRRRQVAYCGQSDTCLLCSKEQERRKSERRKTARGKESSAHGCNGKIEKACTIEKRTSK